MPSNEVVTCVYTMASSELVIALINRHSQCLNRFQFESAHITSREVINPYLI